jgi:hypothetical protein
MEMLPIAATEGSVNKMAGFISSSLHKSLDGTKVHYTYKPFGRPPIKEF